MTSTLATIQSPYIDLIKDPSLGPGTANALSKLHITESVSGSSTPLSSQSYDTDDMEMDDYDEEDGGYIEGHDNGDNDDRIQGSNGLKDVRNGNEKENGTGNAIKPTINERQDEINDNQTLHAHIPDRTLPISPNTTKLKVTDFEMLKTLGTGTFARVWLVRPVKGLRTAPNQFYALKVLRKTDVIRLKQVEHVLNERTILSLCKPHPFIINLLCSWSDRDSLYMLLDYSPGGEVFGYLRRQRRFDFETTKFYAAEITLIMEFLHDNGVVYRDLKPENILLDARGHVKLVDFGFAKCIGDMETYTLCGTPEYLSPEVIQSQGHTTAVDWWAMGILIYEFLVGFPPFYASSPFEIYERIILGKIAFPPWMTSPTRDIISRLCTADRTSRLGNLRNGARDVKAHPFFETINWEELAQHEKNGPIVPLLAFDGDTRNFDNYDPPSPSSNRYTDSMSREYDDYFKDF